MKCNVRCFALPRNANLIDIVRYVSPRRRAQRTLELLGLGCSERFPWQHDRANPPDEVVRTRAKVLVTNDIREWDYGNYEGLTSAQIREQRELESGEGAVWNIWRDGCPGGEYGSDPWMQKRGMKGIY